MRIGIDVGGTNTDAVVLDGAELLAAVKRPTTRDVSSGISEAVTVLLEQTAVSRDAVAAVMLGTTHFTNAVVERRNLARTAILRLGLPATRSIEPFEDWPDDLRAAVAARGYLAHGGNEFDGRLISDVDEAELEAIALDMALAGVEAVAVCAVFSPIAPEVESRVASLVARWLPNVTVSTSKDVGRLGLLERENATALNACLRPLANATVASFRACLDDLGIGCPLFLTQNDGTLMSAELAEAYPVLTFASGPTNSMRGAAFLAGIDDALVLDIGGTTSDVGALVRGFPREAAMEARFGGVRTNFRMPDLVSIGLGGGSRVRVSNGDVMIGPDSVGYELTQEAVVFGGSVVTATDVAVASGRASLGTHAAELPLSESELETAVIRMHRLIADALDRVKLTSDPQPVVLVGGGSILAPTVIEGTSRVMRPRNFEVANAVGAAMAQVSGEIDRIFPTEGERREDLVARAKEEAVTKAVENGAVLGSVEVAEVDQIPVAYMTESMIRLRVKAIGDLDIGRVVATRQ